MGSGHIGIYHKGYMDTLKESNLPSEDAWIVTGGLDKKAGYEGFLANAKIVLPVGSHIKKLQ